MTVHTISNIKDQKFTRKLMLTTPYFRSSRDDEFDELLNTAAENLVARQAGSGMKQSAIVVLGETDSGKSTMLMHHLAAFPPLEPRLGQDGQRFPRVLVTEAPGTCTPKSFAIALLGAMGVPATSRASEDELFSVLKRALKANEIGWVVVDEMQHAIRGSQAATVRKVQNALKGLLQIKEWPVNFIFVGTPELARFLEGDGQIRTRTWVLRLEALDHRNKRHLKFVKSLLQEIIVDTAGLSIAFDEAQKLPERLVQSAGGAMGNVIKTIRQVCFRAIDGGRQEVNINDFAHAYRVNTGCMKSDNIFKSANWEALHPSRAVSDLDQSNKKRA